MKNALLEFFSEEEKKLQQQVEADEEKKVEPGKDEPGAPEGGGGDGKKEKWPTKEDWKGFLDWLKPGPWPDPNKDFWENLADGIWQLFWDFPAPRP